MPALVATRFNPDFKAKPEHEVAAGRAVEPWPGKRDRLRRFGCHQRVFIILNLA
jgi:hypothetical protein